MTTATAGKLTEGFCEHCGSGPECVVCRRGCSSAVKPWRAVRPDTGAAVLFARSAREAFGRAEVHYALRGLPLRVEALTADGWEAVGEVGGDHARGGALVAPETLGGADAAPVPAGTKAT
jgi:hypothetical protein